MTPQKQYQTYFHKQIKQGNPNPLTYAKWLEKNGI